MKKLIVFSLACIITAVKAEVSPETLEERIKVTYAQHRMHLAPWKTLSAEEKTQEIKKQCVLLQEFLQAQAISNNRVDLIAEVVAGNCEQKLTAYVAMALFVERAHNEISPEESTGIELNVQLPEDEQAVAMNDRQD